MCLPQNHLPLSNSTAAWAAARSVYLQNPNLLKSPVALSMINLHAAESEQETILQQAAECCCWSIRKATDTTVEDYMMLIQSIF
jgi:hypothetical protein